MSRDLPALVPAADLPVPVVEAARRHEVAPARAHPRWRSRAAQVEVTDVAVPPDGGVWVASCGGVLRWWPDRERYTRYASEHGLAGHAVRRVAVDGAGAVRALMLDGTVCSIAGETFTSDGADRVWCLAVDRSGRAWSASQMAVASADGAHSIALPQAAGRPRALAVGDERDAWLACRGGLLRWNGAGWQAVLSRPDVLAVVRSDSTVWVGTAAGLQCFDPDAGAWRRDAAWPEGPVRALAVRDGDAAWAAVGAALGLATTDGWLAAAAPRARVSSLAAGADGDVWVGTAYGLLRASAGDLRPVHTDSPPDVVGLVQGWPAPAFSNLIQALAVAPAAGGSTVWIGTPSGLYALQPATERWRHVGATLAPDVRAIQFDRDGGAGLVAGFGGGVRPLTETVGKTAPELGATVVALARAADGACLAATLDCVWAHAEGAWRRIAALPAERAAGVLQALLGDSAGRLWAGASIGLLHAEELGAELVPVAGELGTTDVRALAAAGTAVLAGTDRGLWLLEDGGATPVAGLEEREVACLLYDGERDNAWAGTDAGLARLERAGGEWRLAELLTSATSGLAADHVTALALNRSDPGAPRLWVGTSAGLSGYEADWGR